MTTLDDKLLGEKLQYYYSSSEDEESDHEEEENASKTIRDQEVVDVELDYSADGSSVNTGTVKCDMWTQMCTSVSHSLWLKDAASAFINPTSVRLCVSPTGPKGVINDWRKYKQLENEQRVEQQKEMERLIKKLSMTCKSHLEEEADRQKQKELQEKIAGKVRNTLYTVESTHWMSWYDACL